MEIREAAVGAAYRWRWAALAVLLAAEAMNLLDATIVQVAAPVIHADLGGAESGMQWFSAAYTLPFAVLLIMGGRLGDMAGRRRMFAVGVAGFSLASLCCALVPDATALIAARAVQGSAAALIIPQTIGLIRAMFDGAELAGAMGSIGPVMGLAAICGPVLGAVLTHADLFGSSWRAVFLVNVPLAAAVLAAVPLLREDRAAVRPRLDLPGTVLAIAGAGLVVYPLIQGGTAGLSAGGRTAMAAGVVVLVVFGLQQRYGTRRGGRPLVEPSLFRDRGFPAALATSTLFFAVMNGLMLVVVVQVQVGLGDDVLTAGLTLLPWSCGMAISSWVSGTRLVPRHGSRMMFVGVAVMLAGLLSAIAVYAGARPGAYPWPLPCALALCGVGNGLFTVPFFTTALTRVRPHETGSAAGLLNAVQQFGGTLGIALLGTVFFHSLATGTRAGGTPGTASLHAAGLVFWLAAGLLAAAGVTAALMRTREAASESAEPAHA
ncbi:MFS transporter [Actinoallomurus purpureus]|uniref:MFS transporter n=1 Tax=Actinoallomurus purpureus TaxID=478114 RepID=UPI002092EE10|nr:MFS transporter [Actinoallomurus purpureus]MCO6006337.1 MFS transporter [Actinoallomurus purpureus]